MKPYQTTKSKIMLSQLEQKEEYYINNKEKISAPLV